LPLLLTPTLENLVISLYNEGINDGSGGKEHKKTKGGFEIVRENGAKAIAAQTRLEVVWLRPADRGIH